MRRKFSIRLYVIRVAETSSSSYPLFYSLENAYLRSVKQGSLRNRAQAESAHRGLDSLLKRGMLVCSEVAPQGYIPWRAVNE